MCVSVDCMSLDFEPCTDVMFRTNKTLRNSDYTSDSMFCGGVGNQMNRDEAQAVHSNPQKAVHPVA